MVPLDGFDLGCFFAVIVEVPGQDHGQSFLVHGAQECRDAVDAIEARLGRHIVEVGVNDDGVQTGGRTARLNCMATWGVGAILRK